MLSRTVNFLRGKVCWEQQKIKWCACYEISSLLSLIGSMLDVNLLKLYSILFQDPPHDCSDSIIFLKLDNANMTAWVIKRLTECMVDF